MIVLWRKKTRKNCLFNPVRQTEKQSKLKEKQIIAYVEDENCTPSSEINEIFWLKLQHGKSD